MAEPDRRHGLPLRASRYGPPARAVHRGSLIDALAAALPPGALRLGVSVGGVVEAAEGAVVVRTSAGELRADAVVAADGLRSALRGQLFPRHPGPRYAGETGWRAVLSGAGLPALPAAETWGKGERFGIVPLADGRVYVYATAVTGPGTRPADHRAELDPPLRRLARSWSEVRLRRGVRRARRRPGARQASSTSMPGRRIRSASVGSRPWETAAPTNALSVCGGTPSQSAQDAQCRSSRTRVSPMSRTIVSITAPTLGARTPSTGACPGESARTSDHGHLPTGGFSTEALVRRKRLARMLGS
ncbi:hypothetical protein SBADM41S_06128 [Streptomyces badius]